MITKFEKYNEGIKHLLVGPTEEEAWENLGINFIGLETPPDTVDEFLDYIFENGNYLHDKNHEICRWMFNDKCVFFVLKRMSSLHIYYKIYSILETFYNIKNTQEIINLTQKRLEIHFGKFYINPKRVLSIED